MKKYLVVYYSDKSAAEQMSSATPEEAQAGMEAWGKWAAKVGGNLSDMGAPLNLVGKVTKEGQEKATSRISGYSFVEAESSEQVLDFMDGHPHLMMEGAKIEVFECIPMPGM